MEVQILSDFQHVYKLFKKLLLAKLDFSLPFNYTKPFSHPSTCVRALVSTQTSPVKGEGVGGLGG